jgi:16S rRNA (cytidine1402-2'-O)-methyltransferase
VAQELQGNPQKLKGILYIVSTPIGNLEDITLRALRVLKEADVIAAEDTRHTRKLLSHFGIRRPLISYWGGKEKARAEEALARLRGGQSVALVSDAGTPGISDPGAVLIRKALEEKIEVVPVPGPSALVTALSISGLRTEEFVFAGFLPARKAQRNKALEGLSLEPRTLVFYESPHRVMSTLKDMEESLGDRGAAVVKELTKVHEEVLRGRLSEVIPRLADAEVAGEYVIVIEGRKKELPSFEEALQEVRDLMKKGKGRKEAVRTVSGQYGLSKKDLYDRSLEG